MGSKVLSGESSKATKKVIAVHKQTHAACMTMKVFEVKSTQVK